MQRKKSIFDPGDQANDVTSKIIVGLERLSESFKVLLWEKAKTLGLSPIQIQILIFVAYHKRELCNVSYLAREFNITKPTVSDAVRILDQKKLVLKEFSSSDNRSYTIRLSRTGEKVVGETDDFALPMQDPLKVLPAVDLENLFYALSRLIYQLNQKGILSVQRTCFGCRFYSHKGHMDYCNLLNVTLKRKNIRVDCPEFEDDPVKKG